MLGFNKSTDTFFVVNMHYAEGFYIFCHIFDLTIFNFDNKWLRLPQEVIIALCACHRFLGILTNCVVILSYP